MENLYKNDRVLIVDDDINILHSFRRVFHSSFKVEYAVGGEEGLKKIENSKPYSVVISDMQMPGMNGIEFLKHVKRASPDSIRIMLTGNADMDTAVNAINKGSIFRFLSKPVDNLHLKAVIIIAIKQYRLLTAERDILEKTLNESIKVLIDILSIVNPLAFSRASRIVNYVKKIIGNNYIENKWQFEMAAMLSQIGYISIPNDILLKIYTKSKLYDEEIQLYYNHPIVGAKLISRIPRMENIAYMIQNQQKNFIDYTTDTEFDYGAQILKTVTDYDLKMIQGKNEKDALEDLYDEKIYNQDIVELLSESDSDTVEMIERQVTIGELAEFMILAQDIKAKNGLLVAKKDQQVTFTMIEMLKSFSRRIGIENKILIRYKKII